MSATGTVSVASSTLDAQMAYRVIDRLLGSAQEVAQLAGSIELAMTAIVELELAVVAPQSSDQKLLELADLAASIRNFWIAGFSPDRHAAEVQRAYQAELVNAFAAQHDLLMSLLEPWNRAFLDLMLELQRQGVLKIVPGRAFRSETAPEGTSLVATVAPKPLIQPGKNFRRGWWHEGAIPVATE